MNLQYKLLHKYVLKQFIIAFVLCLTVALSLFLLIDLFDRSRMFIKEDASFLNAASYLIYKIPSILHLMTPVAALVATIISIGRLSQQSEITAMRACGVSVLWLAKPLIVAGLVISGAMFVMGETLVPWSSARVEDIYRYGIKKSIEKGAYSRANFWYRSGEKFFNIDYYDSSNKTFHDFSIFEFDELQRLRKRTDAAEVMWINNAIGWSMTDVVETVFQGNSSPIQIAKFRSLPLVIPEKPENFYNLTIKPETLNYKALGRYIEKLQKEGVPATQYIVDRAAKLSFPFVSVVVILVAFPFGLISARSGTLTLGFIAGVSIGFGYYVFHAICVSLGGAELIPVLPAAWAANILLGSVGGYLMLGTD